MPEGQSFWDEDVINISQEEFCVLCQERGKKRGKGELFPDDIYVMSKAENSN